jgi:hypothetical protein
MVGDTGLEPVAFPIISGCSNRPEDLMVGDTGLEPVASAMSTQCSNQLS